MKRYQIVIFILTAFTLLGTLSYFFPKDGMAIGPMSLKFASLEDILTREEAEEEGMTMSPEELIEAQKAAAHRATGDSLKNYLLTNNTRFHIPEDDLGFFNSLFETLEGADTAAVRVVHYGDSQIEEDRITCVFRDSLHKRFGGDGQGMMPARTHYTFGTSGKSNLEKERFMVFGRRAESNMYGPYGEFVHLDGDTVILSYGQSGRKDHTRKYFNKVTFLAGNTQGEGLSITCGKQTRTFPAGRNYIRAVFDVPDSSSRVKVSVIGSGDLYGVLMDNRTGVSVDNAPMRGCSGTIFTSMNREQLSTFYKDENVRLILMQFGGNRVPGLRNGDQISKFCQTTRKQIKHLQELAPEAKIVYIGPSDMATSVNGKMQSYAILPQLIDSLRNTANSAGAAYWDIYEAMGGKNSMTRWVNSGLAGKDYIHFTTKGSTHMGETFATSFLQLYEYYVWRKKNEE